MFDFSAFEVSHERGKIGDSIDGAIVEMNALSWNIGVLENSIGNIRG
jgi:hypothetical protein